MDEHANKVIEIAFINGSEQTINISQSILAYNHIRPTYLYFTINYQNITAAFHNNKFYLDTAGTQLVTLADGLYDYPQINALIIAPYGGFYYLIQKWLDGNGFGIYRYTSTIDRNSMINGVLQSPANPPDSTLNTELISGIYRPTRFKLWGEWFDIDANTSLSGQNLVKTKHIEIQCSTVILEDDVFEF